MTGSILVLHDVGDEGGGGPWRAALEAAGWEGPVIAPDLPGHAGAPPPVGGDYEVADAALATLPLLPADGERPVVVGVGVNGWSAWLLALGGRASTLVLVDGLGGPPWLDARQRIGQTVEWLREIAADDEAVAAPPRGVALDPRLRHRMPDHGSRRLAERSARALSVPALLLATPAASGAAHELAPLFSAGAEVAAIPDRTPAVVARTLLPVLAALSVRGTEGGA